MDLGPIDVLNLIAFVIAVVSFGHALRSHAELTKVEALRDSTVTVIKNLAMTAGHNTQDEAMRGYLDGIVLNCDVLLKKQELTDPSETSLAFTYDPTAPPFHSQGHRIVEDASALNGKARAGGKTSANNAFLVYGPYVALGITGRFRATFRLRLADEMTKCDPLAEIVAIDVYCQSEHRWLAYRSVLCREMRTTYMSYDLDFVDEAQGQPVEYRVKLLLDGVTVHCDHIGVRRLAGYRP